MTSFVEAGQPGVKCGTEVKVDADRHVPQMSRRMERPPLEGGPGRAAVRLGRGNLA